jgi:hypothetical protein
MTDTTQTTTPPADIRARNKGNRFRRACRKASASSSRTQRSTSGEIDHLEEAHAPAG